MSEIVDNIKALAESYPSSAISARFVSRKLKITLAQVAEAVDTIAIADQPKAGPGTSVNIKTGRRVIMVSFPHDWTDDAN